MTAVFERILEMSLTAAVVIVVVMLIRLLLRRAPRKYSYALWSVAAFRLVCPVSFKAFFSIFRFADRLEGIQIEQTVTNPLPAVSPGYFDSVSPGYFDSVPPGTGTPIEVDPDYMFTYPLTTPPVAETPAAASINWMQVAAILWLVGLAALLIYGVVSYVRLRRRMNTAIVLEGNVWQSDRVQSPFILGFVRPKIYMPFGLNADQQRYVLAHERYHLRRFDHIVRPLSFLILAVHWFNPLVWMAYYMMGRDMEMSCDEKVLADGENVKEYSTTLLSFAANRRFPSPSPLAFGESGVKGRIKNALNWKKPRTWVTIIAIVVCIVVIIVCAANPATHPYDWTKDLTMEDVDWAELMVNGEEQSSRRLLDYEVWDLVELLNGLRRSEMKQPPPRSAWSFPTERMITICCNGIEYKLNLGPSPMVLICNDEAVAWGNEDPWFVGNEELKQFIRDLPGVEKPLPDENEPRFYQSVECLFMSSLSSTVGTDDNGYHYLVWGDQLRLSNKELGMSGSYSAKGEWQELTDELIHSMEWGTFVLGETDLWSTLREERPMIRMYGEDRMLLLLYFGDEMWVGSYVIDRNGYISLWDLYRLEESDGAIGVQPLDTLTTWQADLTHDGEKETITLSYDERAMVYSLRVTNAAGQLLWKGEASTFHMGYIGYYLYEHDGKEYLMEWSTNGWTGTAWYYYEVFSLTEKGEKLTLHYDSFTYDTNSEEQILAINISGMQEYETQLNALLTDAVVLIDTSEGKVVQGDPKDPVKRLWFPEASRWVQEQQRILAERAEQAANTLAEWQVDLLHSGGTQTLAYLMDGEGGFDITVRNGTYGSYWYWAESMEQSGEKRYFLYRENGKDYLADWDYRYTCSIFNLNADSANPPIRTDALNLDGKAVSAALTESGLDLSNGLILLAEQIDPDVGGTSRGLFLYRIQFLSLKDLGTIQTYFVVMDHVWEDPYEGQMAQHTLLGILTEAELQRLYNKEEILKQYDHDLYRAAALETYRKYHNIQTQ